MNRHMLTRFQPSLTFALRASLSGWRFFSTTPQSEFPVKITDRSAEVLKKVIQQDWVKNKDSAHLRLAVKGGGCSGFQYEFTLEHEGEPLDSEDRLFVKNGARFVIDNESLKHLQGATIDYKEQMIRSAFTVSDNPNSEKSCGCGSSFASKVA